MSTIKSDSGKEYTVEGDYQSGYRLTDENGNKSVYAFEGLQEMKNHVNSVERGIQKDVGDFGQEDDDDDYDESNDPTDTSDGYDDQDHLEEMMNYWDSL